MRLAGAALVEGGIQARTGSSWDGRNDAAAQGLLEALGLEEHGCYAITGHTQLSWPARGA